MIVKYLQAKYFDYFNPPDIVVLSLVEKGDLNAMLKFFGRGSAFNDMQNSAYYVNGSTLYLIDCPMSSFNIIRKLGLSWFSPAGNISSIHILVTHTHSDHIGGIPMLIHYAYYVWHVPVTVGAPSEEVLSDLRFVFERLEGCASEAYTLTTADSFDIVEAVIPTTHTPELEGRCFGFSLNLGGRTVVYTGDTNTLLPFLPYIDTQAGAASLGAASSAAASSGAASSAAASSATFSSVSPASGIELYTEISTSESPVHLYIGRELDTLKGLTEEGVAVYLMHLDNEDSVKAEIQGTALKLAPLYNE